MRRIGPVLASLCFVGACGASNLEREAAVAAPSIMKVAPPAPAKVTVMMTAATLGEDCGGAAPSPPPPAAPPPPPPKFAKPPGAERADSSAGDIDPARARGARARARCEPTSMQLMVIAGAGVAPTSIRVKKVELVDDTGKLIGTLTPRAPTAWSDADGVYRAWNETIAPDTRLAVSYVLSRPDWTGVKDRARHAYVVRAVVTVGGADQTVQRDAYISAPTIMPPNVRT
ncbi:MAG: hypothetical protein KIT31_36900 [Deltaproteobacteria bacterium]|nr:hypothetical protein [Deltaproteobacteria bacterium]